MPPKDNHFGAFMASLTIKNIPDKLYEQLRQAAKAHHRSINGELIARLEASLTPTRHNPNELKAAAKLLRERVKAPPIDADEIHRAKNADRP